MTPGTYNNSQNVTDAIEQLEYAKRTASFIEKQMREVHAMNNANKKIRSYSNLLFKPKQEVPQVFLIIQKLCQLILEVYLKNYLLIHHQWKKPIKRQKNLLIGNKVFQKK